MSQAGDYSIGSQKWNGLSKLFEEAGEVTQVCGKIVGVSGERAHWDGSDLKERLEDEMGDLLAAIIFVMQTNNLDKHRIMLRREKKLMLFQQWDVENGQ